MAWKGKTVVITGGTGFIGSHLAEFLRDQGAKIRIPYRESSEWLTANIKKMDFRQGDITDIAFLKTCLEGADYVFHLASFRQHIAFHLEHATEVIEKNVQMAVALVNVLRERPMPLTFFSTANIPPDYTIFEAIQSHVDGYHLGKALCEVLFTALAHETKQPFLCVRPVSVYGPRDKFAVDANVLPALITKAATAEKELMVWGSGRQKRKFVYVEDVIQATCTLLEAGATGIQYLTPPETIAIADLAQKICQHVNPQLTLTFDTTKPEGPHQDRPFPTHSALASFPWTPMDQGLQKTVQWCKTNIK